ncbi:MAG TPA: hypothetical protein ENI63_00330 [Candidatus Kaiserbacteria bacterium]|nr:hypothetical protein [Candidatus Kaiserbacteria bacterium]
MEEETKRRLDEQGILLEKIYTSVEKTRKYFMWTLIISLVVFILPLIGMIFVIPSFLSVYTSGLGGF